LQRRSLVPPLFPELQLLKAQLLWFLCLMLLHLLQHLLRRHLQLLLSHLLHNLLLVIMLLIYLLAQEQTEVHQPKE
jgi:hypothetical protein